MALQEFGNDSRRHGLSCSGGKRIRWMPWLVGFFACLPLGYGIPTKWQVPRPPTNCTCNRQDCKDEAIYNFEGGFFEIAPSHGDVDTGTNICEVLWAMMGCACDSCRDFSYFDQALLVSQDYCGCSTLDVRCMEVDGKPWQVPSSGTCTPVCPPGTYPSEERLTCIRGRFEPANYSCISALPAIPPVHAKFMDTDTEAGYVAGRFQVQLGDDLLAAGARGADVYFGNRSASGSIKAASWSTLAKNESHVRWLPRQALPPETTHFWVFPTNSAELGPDALAIPIRDLGVWPKQPLVADDMEVQIHHEDGLLGGIRLLEGPSCRAPARERAFKWRLRAKHTTTTYYWHLEEAHFYNDTTCSHELLGEVLQSAFGQKVLNKEWQHNSVRSRLEMPAVNAVYGNATEAFNVTKKEECWHGRKDKDGLFWIGMSLAIPSEVACVQLEHCEEFWPAHTALSHQQLVVERYANGGWEFVDGFEADGAPGMYDRKLTLRRPQGKAMLQPVQGATFRPTTSGPYAVCMCTGDVCRDDADFTEAVAIVPVLSAAQNVTIGSGDGSLVLPLNGNTRLMLQGVGLSEHDRLGISSEQCGAATLSLLGLDVAGTMTHDSTGPLAWYARNEVPEPKSMEVCHWIDQCNDLEAPEVRQACRQDARSQARPLSLKLHFLACRPPCQLCMGQLDVCTACQDGLMAFEGKCFNCSRPVLDVLASSSRSRQADGLLQIASAEPLDANASAAALATEVGLRSPTHVAALSPTLLLIADRLSNAIFRLDLDAAEARDRLRVACPQCGAPHLKAPQSVRVAPSGLFWIIVDTGNNRIIKVDASTLQASIVAGSGPTALFEDLPYFHFTFLGDVPIKHTVTSSGDGGLAVAARLCRPTDAAIHRGEEELLILESRCEVWQLPSVRLVDGKGWIRTVIQLGESCEPGSIDWHPGFRESIIVACGTIGLEAYSRDSTGKWSADAALVPSAAAGYTLVSVARWGLDGSLLLAASLDNRNLVVEKHSSLNGSLGVVQRIAGGGTTSLRGTWRGPWSDEAALLSVFGVAAGADGVTYITDAQTAVLLRVRPPCGITEAGTGSGEGYQDRDIDGTLLQRHRCTSCPEGQYNDGSAALQDRCSWCDVAAYETTGNVCNGAAQCACLPGFHRNATSGSCDPCLPGMVCRGYAYVELETNEVEANWSEGSCYDATTIDWPMEACGGQRVSFDLSSMDEQGQPLRAPGHIGAVYADQECDCCFGRYWNPREKECLPCPEGLWCSGQKASPGVTIRVRDGYTATDIDRVYMCAHPSHCQWSIADERQYASQRVPCNTAFVREAPECSQDHCTGIQIGGSLGTCPLGRRGLACGQCEDNGYTPALGAACRSCEGMHLRFYIAVATTVAVPLMTYFLFVNFRLARLHALGGVCSLIGITLVFAAHLQALHGRTMIQWWSLGVNFLETADWAMWYFAPVSLRCLTRNLGLLFFLQWGAPWALIVTLFIFWLLTLPRLILPQAFVFDITVACNVIGMLYAMLVAPITAAPINFFQCYAHPKSSSRSDVLAQRFSMWSDPDTECFRTHWLEASPVALCGLLLPTLWIVVQIHISFFRPLAFLQATDQSRKLFRHHHSCMRFRTGQHYWDLLTAMRVLALELVIALPIELLWQAYILFAINMITLGFVVAYRPHCQQLTNVYEGVCLVAILTTISYGLALTLRDGSTVVSSTAGTLTIGMVLCAFSFACCVCLVALKDIILTKTATEREEERAVNFAAMLHSFAHRVAQGHHVRITAAVESMDQMSLFEAEACLRGLQQFFTPVGHEQEGLKLSDIRWTRLHGFDWRTNQIEDDLRSHHDSLVSTSMSRDRRKSRSAMESVRVRNKTSSKSSRFRRSASWTSQNSSRSNNSIARTITDDNSTVEEAYINMAANNASLQQVDDSENVGSENWRPQETLGRRSGSYCSSTDSNKQPRSRSPATSKASMKVDLMNYEAFTREGSKVSLGSYPSLLKQMTAESLLSLAGDESDEPASFLRERPETAQVQQVQPGDECLSIRTSDIRSSLGCSSTTGESPGVKDEPESPPASPASLRADFLPTIRSERENPTPSSAHEQLEERGDGYRLQHESPPQSPAGRRPQPLAIMRAAQRTQSQAMLRARSARGLSPEQVDVCVAREGSAGASNTQSRSHKNTRTMESRDRSFHAGPCSHV